MFFQVPGDNVQDNVLTADYQAFTGWKKRFGQFVPQIGVISTGDELTDIAEKLLPGKIYNSNLYGIAAFIRQAGAKPLSGGAVSDNPVLIAGRINEMLKVADLALTTGGVSVGDYDAVRESLDLLGAEILFWRINIRPGTPAFCAVKDGKVILSLSGNPAAALITYHLVARPALAKLQGLSSWQPVRFRAVLQDEFHKSSRQRRFLRGQVYSENGTLMVKLTGMQKPGIMKSMLTCNGLIDVPAGTGSLRTGDLVEVIRLSW